MDATGRENGTKLWALREEETTMHSCLQKTISVPHLQKKPPFFHWLVRGPRPQHDSPDYVTNGMPGETHLQGSGLQLLVSTTAAPRVLGEKHREMTK